MKKTILLFSCLLLSLYGFGQQFHMEVFSGYNIPNFDHDAYAIEDYAQAGFSPLGIRIAGGHEYVQLGLEYRQNLTNPDFEVDHNGFKGNISFKETYYGALLRGNISSLPVYRAGIILKAGAGYYTYTQEVTENGSTSPPIDFDKKLGFNGGIGLSAPIYANLHFEFGYSYHFIERDALNPEDFNGAAPPPGNEGYKAGYHAIQAGLSINLMITAKAKAGCQNKRHKSKGKHGRGGWYSK